ncbi:hypothetical protein EYV94_12160 [Puteibacter caeruleilacunae]|nr:hypothetical protein EYV94_12160 [Puteibacter caeruleilacunae]
MMNRIVYTVMGIGVMGYGAYSYLIKENMPLLYGIAALFLGAYLVFRGYESTIRQPWRNVIKISFIAIIAILFAIYFFQKA